MATEAQVRATAKYLKDKQRRIVFYCHREYDADIIEWLDSKENKTEYLKRLIRKDFQK